MLFPPLFLETGSSILLEFLLRCLLLREVSLSSNYFSVSTLFLSFEVLMTTCQIFDAFVYSHPQWNVSPKGKDGAHLLYCHTSGA